MKKLLRLNLQQTIVFEDTDSDKDLTVLAVHDKHKKLLVIQSQAGNPNEVEDFVIANDLEYDKITFGDSFGCDTWDNKILKHTMIKE